MPELPSDDEEMPSGLGAVECEECENLNDAENFITCDKCNKTICNDCVTTHQCVS